MPLLWTPQTIPELGAIAKLPPEERQRIWSAVWPKVRSRWQFWLAVLAGTATFAVVWLLLTRVLEDAGYGGILIGMVCGMIAGLPAGTILAQVTNRLALPHLREELAKRSTESPKSD